MASEFTFKLTAKAENDLDGIVDYIANKLDNKIAAAEFMNKLEAAVSEACAFPESGSLVENEFLPYKNIRKKLVGNYILYYSSDTDAQTICVLRIIYGRRNLDEIVRQMNMP